MLDDAVVHHDVMIDTSLVRSFGFTDAHATTAQIMKVAMPHHGPRATVSKIDTVQAKPGEFTILQPDPAAVLKLDGSVRTHGRLSVVHPRLRIEIIPVLKR
jgi:hypothetical protein